MMSFIDSVHKYKLKTKITSNLQFYQVLSSIGLVNVDIYLKHGPFSSDIGIVNSSPSKGTHWVCYTNEKYFVSYGCVCPKKLSMFIIKRNG